MTSLVRIADSFVNIRASFKIGPADIHTHASLVKRPSNKWIMLDSVKMGDSVKADVMQMTENGKGIEAIVNCHPFHTASCEWAHETFPDAKLYGTLRHKNQLPNLPWENGLIEEEETQALFKDTLQFSVPKGVDLIPSNESVHFSSVLAYHNATKTIHVDDTFMFIPTPSAAAIFGFKEGTVQLHPTLGLALQSRKGASEDLRAWVRKIAAEWQAGNLCTAHVGNLLADKNNGDSIKSRIEAALTVAQPALMAHELYWGKADKNASVP